MKEEYDFSDGVRGKFHRGGATFRVPLYLDPEIVEYLSSRAQARGIETEALVNEWLRRDIAADRAEQG